MAREDPPFEDVFLIGRLVGFHCQVSLLEGNLSPTLSPTQLSHEKYPGWLGYIGDNITQLYRDYFKPLQGFLLANQDSMESRRVLFVAQLTVSPHLQPTLQTRPILLPSTPGPLASPGLAQILTESREGRHGFLVQVQVAWGFPWTRIFSGKAFCGRYIVFMYFWLKKKYGRTLKSVFFQKTR